MLRSTLAGLITATAISGGTASAASADTGSEADHQWTWRTGTDTPAVRQGIWRTKARPKPAPARPRDRNKRIALGLVVQRAWSIGEFRCLDSLWTRESNWNHRATNQSSGAYGIPQALPAGKMSGAGPDWRHNPATQIRWGLKYIKDRYGKPCGAWSHFRSRNWY